MRGNEAPAATRNWRFLAALVCLGLIARLATGLWTDSVHHPDEVFQYLEQGHRLAYGYGVVPWEYRYGIRSWAVPGFIASIISTVRAVGVDSPAIYAAAIKIVFCALSVSLIVSVYYATRQLTAEWTARVAAVFTAFWSELVYFAHKPNPEVVSTYAWFGALALSLAPPTRTRALLAGALAGLCLGLRYQHILLLAPLGLWMLLRWPAKMWMLAAAGFLIVTAGFGWLDYATWGVWFASIVENLRLNGTENVSALFGGQPVWFFAASLTIASAGLALFGVLGLSRNARAFWPLILAALLLLAAHTLIAHKEHRFIFPVIPVWLIGLALLAAPSLAAWRERGWRAPLAAGGFLLATVLGLAGALPLQNRVYYTPPLIRSDDAAAYDALAREPDLQSVYYEVSGWSSNPAYFRLHRDVPLYFDYHFESEAAARQHAQFWLRRADAPPPSDGFVLWRRFGDVAVWRNEAEATPLPGYSRAICQPGVDGRLGPRVTARIESPPARCTAARDADAQARRDMPHLRRAPFSALCAR